VGFATLLLFLFSLSTYLPCRARRAGGWGVKHDEFSLSALGGGNIKKLCRGFRFVGGAETSLAQPRKGRGLTPQSCMLIGLVHGVTTFMVKGVGWLRGMKRKRSEIISDSNLTYALLSVVVGLGTAHRFHGIDDGLTD
jgi:hypothetical protein